MDNSANQHTPTIWVLADDRTGNVNQALGIAEALKLPFEIKHIAYNKAARLPNMLRGKSLLGINKEDSSNLAPPWPDIVLSAGRKTAPIALYIKKKSNKKTTLVHMMWPQCHAQQFDLLVLPKHDSFTPHSNITTTIGAPNRITKNLLASEGSKWQEKFAHLASPKTALLIGGNTPKSTFTNQHAALLARQACALMQHKGGTLLVSSSRRTNPSALQTFQDHFNLPFYMHDVNNSKDNPYLAFLALSDAIIVTGDSISMCSEACATGKPVYIFAPDDLIPNKHKVFIQNLYNRHVAKPLDGPYETWHYTPLEETTNIANMIREKFCG